MRRRKIAAPAALALAGAVLAACALREEGVSDRCADMVNSAWPGGADITERRASVGDSVETAEVSGTANGNKIAAQCRFEHDMLTDFRWLSAPAAAASGSSIPPPEGVGHQ
jgi:hypothetical protein